MVEFELEFDGALLASSGVAESLHAAGGDARLRCHGDAGECFDDASPMPRGSDRLTLSCEND